MFYETTEFKSSKILLRETVPGRNKKGSGKWVAVDYLQRKFSGTRSWGGCRSVRVGQSVGLWI